MFAAAPRLVAGFLCCVSGAALAQVPPPSAAAPASGAPPGASGAPSPADGGPTMGAAAAPAETQLEPIEVVSRRLNEARSGIETQVGASVYTIDAAVIAAMPGGDNGLLNQAILQAPAVAQDSFGQFHVRGEHNGLQYRLNGIILPEGIGGFGQSLDPRLISSLQLITGALPAEYGLRTAGIIDLSTKSGALDPGGTVSLYGGSHGTVSPSLNYGGASGRFHYFVSADAMINDLGIESPDGRSTPLHDRTKQTHAFGYLEDLIDADNRLSLIMAVANGQFQIPDRAGRVPDEGLNVDGRADFPSAALSDSQREQTSFAIVGWQHSHGALDAQTSLTVRSSTLQFTPDPLGDLLFDGLAQSADKRNLALDWQGDAAYQVNDAHTVRAGGFVQSDRSISRTRSVVLPVVNDVQQSATPVTLIDNGARTEHIESLYLQDEWRWTPNLTVNYGLRFDTFSAYTSASQLSPRLNLVWKAWPATTLHAGYARYFSPPPFELVGAQSIDQFSNTSAAPEVARDDTPQPERANYLDAGVLQVINQQLTLGADSYFKRSTQLIDEGQFGAPIILTPFNYQDGRQYGLELTANYATDTLSAYANLAWETAQGRGISTAQFNFSPEDLAYIASHTISLDHEQKLTASGGASRSWGDTRLSADVLLGSGLRASLALPGDRDIPNGRRLPYYTQVNAGLSHVLRWTALVPLTLRLDIVNLFDRQYEIRDGTGVGVGAPQFGPRRGVFVGITAPI
jgi:outer membrane receptor protein involved in Fe transport